MVHISATSATPSCLIYLILSTAQFLPFTTPPSALQIQVFLRPLGSVLPAVLPAAIWPSSSLLPSSVVLRIYHTYAVQVGTYFVVLMAPFYLTFFDIFSLQVSSQGLSPWESTHLSFLYWMQAADVAEW